MNSKTNLLQIQSDIHALMGTAAGDILLTVSNDAHRPGLIYDIIHTLDEHNFRILFEMLQELRMETKYTIENNNGSDAIPDVFPQYIDKALHFLQFEYHHLHKLFSSEPLQVDVRACCLQADRFRDRIISYLTACLVELAISYKNTHIITDQAIASLTFVELVELHEEYQQALRH